MTQTVAEPSSMPTVVVASPIADPLADPAILRGEHRVLLMEELYRRYGKGTSGPGSFLRNLRFWRKKYAWALVVGGAKFVKRTIDIVVSLAMLILLLPLFLAVALCIKLTDGGPILFWQKRVGRWGREFPFPKFRSMVVNAEEIKRKMLELQHLSREEREQMLERADQGSEKLDRQTLKILRAMKNDHGDSVTFKMKKDPRVTWIGRIIRKLSIDELPQLWCVFKGDMSLVGPRPPVPGEVSKYSLSDRRRLDVTPGLTCIWQVSGRGNIPFPEQVKLDVQYIESQSLWMDIKLLLKTVPAVLLGKGAF
jgi:lipopolysaccharide/colanic/teichoic acid biosynthesis glycosyltransferase